MSEELTTTTESTESTATANAQETVLSSDEIRKLIQSTVDKQTASFGKTIATLKKENDQLKKANMTAEELQKTALEEQRAEFEKERAKFQQQKLLNHAQNITAKAGYGEDMTFGFVAFYSAQKDDVVSLILRDDEEKTAEMLDKLSKFLKKGIAADRAKTFKEYGREPKGAQPATGTKENNIAIELGKRRAENAKQSKSILEYYIGG